MKIITRSGGPKLSNSSKTLKKISIKHSSIIIRNKGNPSSVYKLFREVWAGKGLHGPSTLTSVKVDNNTIEDSSEIANEFNNFFVNIATKLKEPVIHTNHDKLSDFCRDRLSPDTKFSIPQISNENVLKFLSSIDINKATGTDMIGPRLLKLAAPFIADEVTYIYNHCISNSIFPSKWKEAKVAPLHYRSISILPVFQKYLKTCSWKPVSLSTPT